MEGGEESAVMSESELGMQVGMEVILGGEGGELEEVMMEEEEKSAPPLSPRKKSVCDPDYATPRTKSTGFYNHPVKRRLIFSTEEEDNSLSSLDSWSAATAAVVPKPEGEEVNATTTTGEEEIKNLKELALEAEGEEIRTGGDKMEEEGAEDNHHSHHHHKRRRRKKKKHSSRSRKEGVVLVVGGGGGGGGDRVKTREVIAYSSTHSDNSSLKGCGEGDNNSISGGTGGGDPSCNKENNNAAGGGGGAVPPRRIAQLVVWTKNLAGGDDAATVGGKKKGKEETTAKQGGGGGIGGTKSGAGGKRVAKEEEDKRRENEAGGNGGGLGGKKEGKKKISGGGDQGAGGGDEGDLFFVQYPARPFADQGKGKGKPFRRLNSYNDPIVYKKTPPPVQPSERRRRPRGEGGGGGEGRKRKRSSNANNANLPNKKEATTVVIDQPYRVEAEEEAQQQQAIYQAYLQDYFAGVTAYPESSGQVISLLAPPPPPEVESHPTLEYIAQENSAPPPVIFSLSPTPPVTTVASATLEAVGGAGGGGGDSNVFELPDRFTVTTDSANEFDLLIQNVVHEELVNVGGGGNGGGVGGGDHNMINVGGGEEEELGQLRKRMRLGGDTEEDNMNLEESGLAGGMGGDGQICYAEDSYRGGAGGGPEDPGKPRCTYTELIEKALTESGGLTVSEIYNWISERYPYYRQDDDRWKNSVRHNLSINPYFKKGEKARSGAGHLWTISEESKGLRPSSMVSCWDERRKSPCDPGDLLLSMDNDTDRAVANILGMYRSKVAAAEKGLKDNPDEGQDNPLHTPDRPPPSQMDSQQQPQQQPQESTSSGGAEQNGASTSPPTSGGTATITLNQLNSGQFTVDLSGISIPEGGTINFDELVTNGRLIYIETAPPGSTSGAVDPEANKENEHLSTQAENILAELTGGGGGGGGDHSSMGAFYGHHHQDGSSSQLSLDLGGFGGGGMEDHHHHQQQHNGGKGMSLFGGNDVGGVASSSSSEEQLRMVPPAEVIAPTPGGGAAGGHLHQNSSDYGSILDQCLHPMASSPPTYHHELASALNNEAAYYESKELGLSYTYQSTTTAADHPPHHLHPHSDLLQ